MIIEAKNAYSFELTQKETKHYRLRNFKKLCEKWAERQRLIVFKNQLCKESLHPVSWMENLLS